MALPKYALYAWRQAAAQHIGSSKLSWGVWLVVVLEVASLLAFLQVGMVTNTVFVLVPLGLLFANAAIRANGLGQSITSGLLPEPLALCWPAAHSRLGLCRSQAPAGRFVLCGVLLQVACLACFWLDANARTLFSHHDQKYCPGYLLPESMSCGAENQEGMCVYWAIDFGKSDIDALNDFKRAEGSCGDLCIGNCGPEEVVEQSRFGTADTQYKLQCQGCQLGCCRCVACHLSSLPHWQRNMCIKGVFSFQLASDFGPIANEHHPYWHQFHEQHASFTSSNALSVVLARCALAHSARQDGWPAPEVRLQGWFGISSLLLLCPVVALVLRALVFLALPNLWATPCDEDVLRSLAQEAEKVRQDVAKRSFKASMKQKIEMYREFGFFLADCVSDYYTLVELLLAQQWQFGVAQALAIAVSMALDCLKGKVQLVEVVAAFASSRKKGIPTNELILALRSEKGAEAPMSMCLTYLCLFQATSLRSFASRLVSLVLSIINISRYVYTAFELGLSEVIENNQSQEALAQTIGDPSQPPSRLASPSPPDLPPGIVPPVSPPPKTDMRKADLPPGIIYPRRKSRESCVAPLPPITVKDQKVAEKE